MTAGSEKRCVSPSTTKNSPSRRKCATGSRPTCRRRWRRRAAAAAPATSPRSGCCSGRRSSPARLALPELAEGIWRAGLELDAEVHLRDGDGARRFALSLVVQHQDGGARPDEVRQRRRRRSASCPRSPPPRSCGARAIPSRARAPISRACAPRRSGRAITTSSTARRSGPPTPTAPTGSSAWCAPPTRASGRRASPSC